MTNRWMYERIHEKFMAFCKELHEKHGVEGFDVNSPQQREVDVLFAEAGWDYDDYMDEFHSRMPRKECK